MAAKTGIVLVFLMGLALGAYLVMRIGFAPVFDAALRVGWTGFGLIILSGFVLEILPGLALRLLVPGKTPWPVFIAARQLRA